MNIKPADLILVKGTGPICSAIEDISHSPYCHTAGFVYGNELLEANAGRKTGYASLSDYAGESDVFTCDSLTDSQRTAIIDYAVKQIGTRYDYELIAWEAVHYVFHCNLPYHEHGKFDCSQLWYDAYKSAGIDLLPGSEYVSPGDLTASKLLRKVGAM